MKSPGESTSHRIESELVALADPDIAAHSMGFFKTGPGEYGEGDQFLGLRVPVVRERLKRYPTATLDDAVALLHSPWHEVRLFAVLLMVRLYAKGSHEQKEGVYRTYLDHLHHVNNWDLVDSSAHKIVGAHLCGRSHQPLFELAGSPLLWARRIAVISTFAFISRGEFDTSLDLCKRLLGDKEDLMHKACGWVLREVGKRDKQTLIGFLDRFTPSMPRTMLRYAIERLPAEVREHYLGLT